MPQTTNLGGVAETLLLPLYNRAMESQRPDAMIKDEKAVELVFDGWKPFEIWVGNRYLSPSRFGGLMQWGFWSSREIEGWGAGISLLGAWGFFDQPEPRLNSYRWMASLFRLFKPIRVFHFRLGKATR